MYSLQSCTQYVMRRRLNTGAHAVTSCRDERHTTQNKDKNEATEPQIFLKTGCSALINTAPGFKQIFPSVCGPHEAWEGCAHKRERWAVNPRWCVCVCVCSICPSIQDDVFLLRTQIYVWFVQLHSWWVIICFLLHPQSCSWDSSRGGHASSSLTRASCLVSNTFTLLRLHRDSD